MPTTDHPPASAESATPSSPRHLLQIALLFLKLGCISFGGPIAHLGYLRDEFVKKRRWLEDDEYADLVALCQFLPGPASSQVVFALGMKRARLPGALAASIAFTLPSAILMILFAYGIAQSHNLANAGWLHGLKLAAVAVVAHAVLGMGRKLCTDLTRAALCIAVAIILTLLPTAWMQVSLIAACGTLGWLRYRHTIPAPATTSPQPTRPHPAAATALILFLAILLLFPFLAAATPNRTLDVFDAFYRAGSLVFGGGHVVLPLLRAEVVPRGWLSDDTFLAGYAAAQAIPGPLFTFSAYLGAAMQPGPFAWAHGLWALFAIFLPAWLLIGGTLPYWQRLRAKPWAQAALRGANAGVVGILLAALYHPVITESVHTPRDALTALLAFLALQFARLPAWALVLLMAAAGQWLLR